MDTGAAGRSYSIVEQGRVEEFITASPAERRTYMEEAAGIVRYKTKRIAAERKMEQTRQNLLRVGDLQGELNRQEGQLRAQKEKAQQFLELRDRVNRMDAQLARAKFQASARRCEDLTPARAPPQGNCPSVQSTARRSRAAAFPVPAACAPLQFPSPPHAHPPGFR